jgi:hypothetical protein
MAFCNSLLTYSKYSYHFFQYELKFAQRLPDPKEIIIMSALRKPVFEPQYSTTKPQFQPPRDYHQKLAIPHHQQVKKVANSRKFPQQSKLPQNLQLLSLLQKSSFALALVSMTTSIGLYVSTVQIPELWSQEYRNLEDLQSQERELIAINEKIKYQIAHDASQDHRLAISNPNSAIFISPAKVNLKNGLATNLNNLATSKLKHSNLGY